MSDDLVDLEHIPAGAAAAVAQRIGETAAPEHRRRFGSVCDAFDGAARTYNGGSDVVLYCASCRFVLARTVDGEPVDLPSERGRTTA